MVFLTQKGDNKKTKNSIFDNCSSSLFNFDQKKLVNQGGGDICITYEEGVIGKFAVRKLFCEVKKPTITLTKHTLWPTFRMRVPHNTSEGGRPPNS